MTRSPRPIVAGIAWYRAATYQDARARMVDGQLLPESYEKWLYRAHQYEEKLRRSGWAIVRVNVDGDDFTAFCRARGLNLDSDARRACANTVAMQVTKLDPHGNG